MLHALSLFVMFFVGAAMGALVTCVAMNAPGRPAGHRADCPCRAIGESMSPEGRWH